MKIKAQRRITGQFELIFESDAHFGSCKLNSKYIIQHMFDVGLIILLLCIIVEVSLLAFCNDIIAC